jgi:hypothetical protein
MEFFNASVVNHPIDPACVIQKTEEKFIEELLSFEF